LKTVRRGFVYTCVLAAIACLAYGQDEAPQRLFSFGIVADIQYADQSAAGAREYRQSIEKLQRCVSVLSSENTSFVVQLGDLVDGGLKNLDRILPIFQRISAPRYSVLGNHDFSVGREVLLKRFGMPTAYYAFSVRGWRFLVLDGMQVSVGGGWPESDPRYRAGRDMLAVLEAEHTQNAAAWNGAVGEQQRKWLQQNLAEAAEHQEHVIVFCHFPVLVESCRPTHLLWDHLQVLAILESANSLVAYMNGHDHQGGYAERKGIHYLTFPGMVEHDAEQSCKVVDVCSDRLVVREAGSMVGQDLKIRAKRTKISP
jgi:manganese-dependent ADP-ribose/CDP-alcohol diphosphatase